MGDTGDCADVASSPVWVRLAPGRMGVLPLGPLDSLLGDSTSIGTLSWCVCVCVYVCVYVCVCAHVLCVCVPILSCSMSVFTNFKYSAHTKCSHLAILISPGDIGNTAG